jgi:(2Fe-2S) ferredoxin
MEALARGVARRVSGSGWLAPVAGMQLAPRQRLPRAQAAPEPVPQLRPQRSLAAGAPVAGLHKERKKLAKALKAHRNRLHKLANSAVSPDRATLADLVAELERLHAQLEAPPPRAARRSAPAAAAAPAAPSSCCAECRMGLEGDEAESDAEVADDCAELDAAACAALRGGRRGGGALLVHTLGRTIELAAPQLEEEEDAGGAPPVYLGEGTVSVCQGGKCQRQGAAAVLQQVAQLAGGSEGVQVTACKCLGRCGKAPALKVKQEGQPCAVYTQVTPAAAGFVLDRHFERQRQRQGQGQGAERLMA